MTSVTPLEECMICFDEKPSKDMADLKCWSPDNDHSICNECYQKEGQRRKSLGFQHPNECFICKPLQERIEPVIINVNDNITIHVNNTNSYKCPPLCPELSCWAAQCLTLFLTLFLTIVGIVTWNISAMAWNCIDGNCEWNFEIFLPFLSILCGLTLCFVYAMVSSPFLICWLECCSRRGVARLAARS